MDFTAFDLIVFSIVLLSAALGLWRGVIREVFSLAAWVAAVVVSILQGEAVARLLPLRDAPSWLVQLSGHVLVFVAVFVALSLVGYLFTRLTHAVGLGFLDRSLGMMFGIVRGGLVVVLLVLLAGGTTWPAAPWWRESITARPLETVAALLRARLPDDLARHLRLPPPAAAAHARTT
ncbi:MAG: CvpA family protein [Casimicrobiaceae bacterium]